MRTTDFPASRGCAGDGQHEARPLHDRLRERYSPLRAAYIARVRVLSRLIAQAYYASREALGFPMCKREAAA